MRRKEKYAVNDRVEYMAKKPKELSSKGEEWKYRHGYIKAIRHKLLGPTAYVICIARTEDIDIVPENHIFGRIERRENLQGTRQ